MHFREYLKYVLNSSEQKILTLSRISFQIYVAGPVIGAVLAGLVYKYIFDPNTGTSSNASDNSSFYDSDDHMMALQTVSSSGFSPDESRA